MSLEDEVSRSLLEVLRNVTLDPGEHAAFSADPAGYLAQYGYEDVPADDLAEAFSLVADTLPADVAQTVSPTALGAEPSDAGASGFGQEGTQLASEGFAGPDLDVDPAETTFGAVNNDFDEDAVAEAGGGLGQDDLGADAADAADDEAGFHFGEGSESFDGDDVAVGGVSDASIGAETGDLDASGEGFTDAAGGDYGVGPADVDVEVETADFGGGETDDDFDLDDGLDDGLGFGNSGDTDIDDIGAF
jgi:hypothetical protein